MTYHTDLLYNDNKGISYLLHFYPLIPDDTNTRKNAKKKPENYQFFAHKVDEYEEFLEHLFSANRRGDLNSRWRIIRGNELETSVFKLTYSIPKTQYKDLVLDTVASYNQMKNHATRDGTRTRAEAVIDMYEVPVCLYLYAIDVF
jgi:hypothetical protein